MKIGFSDEQRRRALASLIVAAITVLLVLLPKAFLGLTPEIAALIVAAGVWLAGPIALAAGLTKGAHVALIGGFLFVNLRFLLVLPGDASGAWFYDYVAAVVGYALSSYEAVAAWRLAKAKTTFKGTRDDSE